MTSDAVLVADEWSVSRAGGFRIGPVHLEIKAGEVVSCMGPSGIGKTTLLLTLLGYQEPGLQVTGNRYSRGRLLAAGEIPEGALYIPQHVPFNPNWEVEAFLSRLPWGHGRPAAFLRLRRSARIRRIHQVLDQLAILPRARATVAELSGGEVQRAALAQMILMQPTLVIADEFVSSLDPGMSLSILDRCRETVVENHGAALIALHDLKAALHVSDRILVFWPAELSTPWLFEAHSSARDMGRLYTCLCLARWSLDVLESANVRALIEMLHAFVFERLAACHFPKIASDGVLAVSGDGGLTQPEPAMQQAVVRAREFDHDTGFRPLRLSFEDKVLLGFSTPLQTGRTFSCVAITSPRPMGA